MNTETPLDLALALLSLREEDERIERILSSLPCPFPSLHYSDADDSLNTKVLTLADCGYCEGKVVVKSLRG